MAWANRRFRASAKSIALLALVAVPFLASGACTKSTPAAQDALCTPGLYTLCLCQNADKGTHQCAANGQSFGACEPCPDDMPVDAGQISFPNDSSLSEPMFDANSFDGGTLFVDANLPPQEDAPPFDGNAMDSPVITDACSGKLALIGGNSSNVYTAIYSGDGTYAINSSGVSLNAYPAILPVNSSGFEAVFLTNAMELNSIATTTGTSWSLPARIGTNTAKGSPALTALDSNLELVYLADDGTYYHSESIGSGWDSANDPLTPPDDAGVQSFGPAAPTAVGLNDTLWVAYGGSDFGLYRQSWTEGSGWSDVDEQDMAGIGSQGATPPPTMIALNGGTSDLLIAYENSGDLKIAYVVRDADSQSWSEPAFIDPDTAYASDPLAIAPLSNGRAMLVYRGTNAAPYYTLYDPSQSPVWSTPEALVPSNNPVIASTPAIAVGQCGEDAVVAYAESAGAVRITRFTGSTWSEPSLVSGISNLTYVGIAEHP
jgi:hypothetical protein